MAEKVRVKEATGAKIGRENLKKNAVISLEKDADFGENSSAVQNTKALNAAIRKLHQSGGGTVVIPAGTFWLYTVELKSNVNICLSEGCILQAAKPGETQEENYLEPEVRKYAGIQDHGHTYFANSFFYAEDQENIMICGKGVLSGSFVNEEGVREFVLRGDDPAVPKFRNERGHRGIWFGNKGIAMINCRNIVLADFSIVIGGHFAIITEGVDNLLIDRILVDTNRDALDLDCCQNVTVTNSTFNSLTDDGIVVKASYGAERFFPSANILIEDCTVSGYDAGSVYSKEFTKSKQVADDLCGPTGRVKLGTESTCGYEQVTVRRVHFDRSRGFALEAVDAAPLHDILFEDCVMEHISSSPFFIRAGERGRFPVTGNSGLESSGLSVRPAGVENAGNNRSAASLSDRNQEGGECKANVRLDNLPFIIPDKEGYDSYPAGRYKPSYNRSRKVTVDGESAFYIVDETDPARINEANLFREDGKTYPLRYDDQRHQYIPDYDRPLREKREEYYYANAIGNKKMAKVSDIVIRNVKVTDVDPRYPILLMGLQDSPIERVSIENVEVHYRGGMTMEQATEQRQLFSEWEFAQSGTAKAKQKLPWLVNPFFLKNEGLLPRADYDPETKGWKPDPYNVPEMPEVYPEPSNWGILPAYGIYARHVKDLNLRGIRLYTGREEERHVMVLDDVENVTIAGLAGKCGLETQMQTAWGGIVTVTNHFRRKTNLEYVPNEPYFTTGVRGLEIAAACGEAETETIAQRACRTAVREDLPAGIRLLTEADVTRITVNAPAPGTPPDELYPYPTAAIPENGYEYKVKTSDYPYPVCVFPDVADNLDYSCPNMRNGQE